MRIIGICFAFAVGAFLGAMFGLSEEEDIVKTALAGGVAVVVISLLFDEDYLP